MRVGIRASPNGKHVTRGLAVPTKGKAIVRPYDGSVAQWPHIFSAVSYGYVGKDILCDVLSLGKDEDYEAEMHYTMQGSRPVCARSPTRIRPEHFRDHICCDILTVNFELTVGVSSLLMGRAVIFCARDFFVNCV